MFKRVLIFIVSLALMLPLLAGCSLVTDNNERDSLRVIATISPINETLDGKHTINSAGYYVYNLPENFFIVTPSSDYGDYDEDTLFYEKGGFIYIIKNGLYEEVYDVTLSDLEPKTEEVDFKFEGKDIYKYQLFSYINSYANEYIQNYGYTLERVVEQFMDTLLEREITLVEAERYITRGDIVLDNAFYNSVNRAIYEQIDSQYRTYLKAVQKEKGMDVSEPETGEADGSTITDPTYPLYPHSDEANDEGEELWDITDPKRAAKWPGMMGSVETKSNELEAMARLINALENTIKNDFRLNTSERASERKEYLKEFDDIRTLINTQGLVRVYPMLGSTKFINYLIGKSIAEEKKLELLQDFIDGEIEVTDDEVLSEYNRTLRNQTEMYTDDLSKYHAASGEKLMLFNPDPYKHIYVKHILIQFNDDQKLQLEKYRQTPTTTVEGYEQLRNELASQIIGYEHVNGEDDTTRPLTLNTISNIIRSQMAQAANARDAEITFDKLIYKYNQDPGMFESALGYAVINELVGEETDQYVPEFSKGARDLRNEENPDGSRKYAVGDMLDYNIVSDFGVHFMYYSYERPIARVSLHDPVTPAGYETYYDLLKEAVKSTRSDTIYSDWKSAIIRDYKEISKKITIFESRYQSIYK